MPEWKQEIRRRLGPLKLDPSREESIIEELSRRLDDYYAELLAGGATPPEAERRALIEVHESEMLQRELATLGIYGVVSFDVSRRTKEMGVRIALGARQRDIYWAVLGASGRPVALGLLVGLTLALAGASALDRGLAKRFAMNTHDPLAFAAAGALLVAVALAAMLGPAWRATRVDPMLALREE
ncbi:MAG TPA: FtsX-like permease family protein [Blastocatellia bacterium]|nr:FtsX-like permease family protein [Blastocatellia bacterium]